MGSGVSIIEATIAQAQDGMRLDRALADLLPDLSRERLKALINDGHVRSTGQPIKIGTTIKVATGQSFAITLPAPVALETQAQDIPLNIVHEDADLIVVDKPAGLVVHPAAGNLDGTLVNALLHHCQGQLSGIGGVARPGIVHRIDKDTSGLLVVAKSDKAHDGLARQFKDHSIQRLYAAIVYGHPQPATGTVDAWLGRSDADRKKMAVHREGRGKHAVTHYRTVERLRDAAMVECRLETGRTHQVRVHMHHIGHPLIGDPVYGRERKGFKSILETLGFKRQALHAKSLGFIHPVTDERLMFQSALPADMQELLSLLHV
ncbi:MAG: RluA family pseudouridine synthase [Alphaproteobacteria bacterium]|uniref:RluA family pseudouridine synthase n=1 Tax=unclassified Sphingobium TaxID=2611147 RepID=UPI000D176D16|nr:MULTISPECIES: RluA family pseudouridine synthase [unclassified Sphingobium]MBU2017790.1 RluA family pseudouridine synthase [Alphaproteobacteria bacterium]MBG6117240.1 23S rRNA pseudouridine1911/1915/1917 synthase [Sphingobium sp. JAI105]PSO11225.1 RluA family pseudouridine synthase [Sphingobium sp. AEW4]TWD12554.1 ribosomal large subunit pseudouridine synthase D [Sphingobium sp. AEW010]TWD30325.1 ribosomal large subunit pseudouridine synthase D [Sphingobium sp. AEW013]